MTGQENNQIDHEISPSDITKWEQGGVKPEGEREHTSNCRSAVFGAKGALHGRQWMMLMPFAPGGRRTLQV